MTNVPRPAVVLVGTEEVTIKQPGRSALVVAKILGRYPQGSAEPDRLWLDRLVHDGRTDFEGWRAWGAVSTVLERTPAPG